MNKKRTKFLCRIVKTETTGREHGSLYDIGPCHIFQSPNHKEHKQNI